MLTLWLAGLAIACVYFAAAWAISVRIDNYGLLDVAWSYGISILAPMYAWLGPGEPVRKWLLTGIGVAWSARLGTHILLRVIRHHPAEDPRYQTLRERWPSAGKFLIFFEIQAVLVAVFSLPFLLVSFNRDPLLAPIEIAGLALALVAFVGETTADLQLQAFKRGAGSNGDVCQVGLWRYSRHPNYFFESVIWWAFLLVALGSPRGWIAIVCPLLMLYSLFRVTGIPLTEKHALRSKGVAYREYQRTTSAFVPWFRKA